MSSILRRGRVPVPPTGISNYVDQVYTIKGFFGPWAHLYRKHNTAHVTSASRPDLIYQGIATAKLEPADSRDQSKRLPALADAWTNRAEAAGLGSPGANARRMGKSC